MVRPRTGGHALPARCTRRRLDRPVRPRRSGGCLRRRRLRARLPHEAIGAACPIAARDVFAVLQTPLRGHLRRDRVWTGRREPPPLAGDERWLVSLLRFRTADDAPDERATIADLLDTRPASPARARGGRRRRVRPECHRSGSNRDRGFLRPPPRRVRRVVLAGPVTHGRGGKHSYPGVRRARDRVRARGRRCAPGGERVWGSFARLLAHDRPVGSADRSPIAVHGTAVRSGCTRPDACRVRPCRALDRGGRIDA